MPKFFGDDLRFNDFLIQYEKNEIDCPRLRLVGCPRLMPWSNVEITLDMKVRFFHALENNSNTTFLFLDSLINESNVHQFLASLEKNTCITFLSYDTSKLSKSGNTAIQDILNRNRDLAFKQDVYPVQIKFDKSDPKNTAFKAIENGNINLLYSMLEDSPSLVNALDDYGASLLYLATAWGYINCIKLLLARGAKVDGDEIEYIPLSIAVLHDNHVAARILLDAGARVNLKANGFPIFHNVSNIDMANLLLTYGADINAVISEDTVRGYNTRGCAGDSSLQSIIHDNHHKTNLSELVLFLLRHGAKIGTVNMRGETLLHTFVGASHVQAVYNPQNANVLEYLNLLYIILRAGLSMLHTDNQKQLPRCLAKRLGSPYLPVIEKLTRNYTQIRHASLFFSQAKRTNHLLFSKLPFELLEKIALDTINSNILDEQTAKIIFRTNYGRP